MTALIFRSGRVVLTGGTTSEQCQKAALRICRRINHACYNDLKGGPTRLKPFAVYRFRVENVVAAFKCPHRLGIERMYEDYCQHPLKINIQGRRATMVYRPSRFTAVRLLYKKGDEKLALMIFINGNVTLSGLKTKEDAEQFAIEFYESILSKYERLLLTIKRK